MVAADIERRKRREKNFDEIEIRLKYQVECTKRGIDFPVPITSTLYGANVTHAEIREAVRQIRDAENDRAGLVTFFATELPFWQRHLESTYPDEFAAATAPIKQDMEALAAHLEGSDTDVDVQSGKGAAYFRSTYLEGRAPATGASERAAISHDSDVTELTLAEQPRVLDAINAREQQVKTDLYMRLTAKLL